MKKPVRSTSRLIVILVMLTVPLYLISDAYARHWLVIDHWAISIDRACKDGANIAYRLGRLDMPNPGHTYNVYSIPDLLVIGSGTMSAVMPPVGSYAYGSEHVYWNQELDNGDRIFWTRGLMTYMADVQNCELSDPNDLLFQVTRSTIDSTAQVGIVTSTLTFEDPPYNSGYDRGDNFLVYDVNVMLQVKHQYDNLIKMQLTSPSGTKTTLMTRVGNSGTDFGDVNISLGEPNEHRDCGGISFQSVTQHFKFDDDSRFSLLDTSFYPPFSTVNFKPEGPDYLNTFNGERAIGDWTLEIIDDDWDPATSQLICWGLDIWGVPIDDTFLPVISRP